MSVSRSYNYKKRTNSRLKKRKKRIGTRLQYGRTMKSIKREGNRRKFGKKGS